MTTLDAAMLYLGRGFSVIPLKSRDKKPSISSWREFQERHATQEEVAGWFKDGKNNIGIVTGKISGIDVVDFDTKGAIDFAKSQGSLKTPLVKTGKGYHAYCLHSDGVRNFQKRDDLPGIDLRGDGGYVVAPPSVHESGAVYQWVRERSLDDLSLSELPDWILATKPEHKATATELFSAGAEKGSRNDAIARIAGKAIASGDSLEAATEFCLTWNTARCKPPLSEQEVVTTVKSIYAAHIRNSGDTGTPYQWPEPILFGEIETPEITANYLPDPLAGFCGAVTASTQTPPGMAVMMALAVVATCLQKRFEVCPFGDTYTEPLNLMTLTGAEPATRKSAIVKAMTAPLMAWETEQADKLKDQIARVRHERDMVINSINSIKSHASKVAATDEDRRGALEEIKRLEGMMPPDVIAPRLWADDVTMETLQSLMADNGERMSVISAEGGFFEVAAGLYSGGKSNVNIVLQGHAGEPVRVERQGRTVMMQKPALTFGLMVQPSIISDLAAGNKARFRGNGMLARLLYCIPKSTVGSRDVTKRRPIPEFIKAEYQSLIFRLLAIPPLSDESGRERPRLLSLAPEALLVWLNFSQYIESKQGQYGEFYGIQDWTGKLPGAALRIAGLCHVVEHGEKSSVISKATILKALDLSEQLIVHAKAAFGLMGSDPAIPDAKYILQWLTRNGAGSFRRGDLHKATHSRFQRVDRLIAALKVLTERNIISEPQERPTGRRPEIVYHVNPAILEGGIYGMA